MDNGVDRSTGASGASRAAAKDAMGAVALAEGAIAERVLVALRGTLAFPERNAFGDRLAVEPGASVPALLPRFIEAVEEGKRAALVAGAHDLAGSRDALRAIAVRRMGTVVHAVAERGTFDATALGDLGWGMLFAAGVEEALDLTLVARRAAEDCGTPFFVVHESGAARHVEALAAPSRELVEVFVGAPKSHVRALSDAAHPSHAHVSERAFAERVPFALGSALRELESLTGRRRDVLERAPASGDAALMLVAVGELGESLVADVARLRAQGHDVGALKLTALRPFPGPRIVKAMARAVAITVLESVDEPLAQSGPLAREVKAAFADAITWAPDYPGIGRIPRIAVGVARGGRIEASDLDAVVANMIADERGKRSFVIGEEPSFAHTVGTSKTSAHTLSMRGRVRDAKTAEACAEIVAAVVSSSLGLHVRASVRAAAPGEGEGAAFDLLASRERPRGLHAPHVVRLVALEDAAMLASANPLSRLADDGVLAIPSRERSADAVWGDVPAYAKAIVFDRGASVVGWVPPDEADPHARAWLAAAAFAGLALACGSGRVQRAPVDGSLVAREVAEALRVALGPGGEGLVARGADLARHTFESRVEVPRATVERDEASVRLGRRDTRASQPPR